MTALDQIVHEFSRPVAAKTPRRWSFATKPRATLPPYSRYSLAFLFAVAGFGIRLLLHPFLGIDTPILISSVAVAFAARIGGFGPGVLATFVSLAGGVALLLPPWSPTWHLSLSQDLRLLLFLVTGIIVSGLTEALSQTTSAWLRAEQEQENRVLQERNRMAREIHDTLAQGLTGIVIQLEAAEDTMSDDADTDLDAARAHILRAQELARFSLSEARRSVQALRPQALEDRDLAGALAHTIEQMTAGTGVRADVTSEGLLPAFLTTDTQSQLLRIGVEAVTNALKHARAERIALHLRYEAERVTLSIKDDGRGFVPHTSQNGGGFGLTGMWERAERIGGHFTLVSNHGAGTEIIVTVSAPSGSVPGKRDRR